MDLKLSDPMYLINGLMNPAYKLMGLKLTAPDLKSMLNVPVFVRFEKIHRIYIW